MGPAGPYERVAVVREYASRGTRIRMESSNRVSRGSRRVLAEHPHPPVAAQARFEEGIA
jgi:hypothetical protein